MRIEQFVRYMIAGGINTVITYALLLLAMRWFDYFVAYTVVYLVGIVIGYILQCAFVFGVTMGPKTLLRFPLAYVVQYAVGVVILWVLVDVLDVRREVAALLVIIGTVGVGFAMSRLLLNVDDGYFRRE